MLCNFHNGINGITNCDEINVGKYRYEIAWKHLSQRKTDHSNVSCSSCASEKNYVNLLRVLAREYSYPTIRRAIILRNVFISFYTQKNLQGLLSQLKRQSKAQLKIRSSNTRRADNLSRSRAVGSSIDRLDHVHSLTPNTMTSRVRQTRGMQRVGPPQRAQKLQVAS